MKKWKLITTKATAFSIAAILAVTEDGNTGMDSGGTSEDSSTGSLTVTEPQQPDTETPPDYYEEDYYYGDD